MSRITHFVDIKRLQQKFPLLFAAFFGALLPFGFAPFGWVIPSLASVFAILYVWQNETPSQAKKSGFVYGFSAFVIGTYWTYISVGIFGGAPVWLALIIMLGLAALMASYYCVLAYVLTRLFARVQTSTFVWVLAVASCWTLMEWFRSWFLSGFPWLNLGYLSLDTPLAGFAPLGGVYFCTFLWIFLIACTLNFLGKDTKQKMVSGILIIGIFVSGAFLNKSEWTENVAKPIEVALVQGGVPQDQKWVKGQLPKTMQLYTQLSRQHTDVDLMLWPEAAIPTIRPRITEYFLSTRDWLGNNTTLMVGMLDQLVNKDSGEQEMLNGLLVIDADFNTDKEQAYYKDHLVPFGEYFPVPGFVRSWLRMMNLPYSDITRGGKKQNVLRSNGLSIGAFICYEDAYTERVNAMLPEANILVNISNDAWFGGSLAPHQHLQITRMRALETERPILRATNNGITAIINKKGDIVKTVPQFEPQVLRASVQGVKGATPFVMLGNWLIISLCGVYVFFILLIRKSRKVNFPS